MTNQQIIEKAISKAIDNGWEESPLRYRYILSTRNLNAWEILQLIYDHQFAKALWGDELVPSEWRDQAVDENWRIHLQSMVIADDPIKYLGDNI